MSGLQLWGDNLADQSPRGQDVRTQTGRRRPKSERFDKSNAECCRRAPWAAQGPRRPVEPEFVLAPSRSIPEAEAPTEEGDGRLPDPPEDGQSSRVQPQDADRPPEEEPNAIRRRIGSKSSPRTIRITRFNSTAVITSPGEGQEVHKHNTQRRGREESIDCGRDDGTWATDNHPQHGGVPHR